MDYNKKLSLAVNIVSAALLLLAILDMPYGYYIFIRITICLSAIYNIILLFKTSRTTLGIIFILVAILFNPLIIIAFDKGIWIFIDLIVALVYSVNSYLLYIKK